MEIVSHLLTLLVPSSIVLYGMYLLADRFLSKHVDDKLQEQRNKTLDLTLPIRLQAYERMVLFLERITPANLLLRRMPTATHVSDLHQALLQDIREEYQHNLAQQLYISAGVWAQIADAKESVSVLVNQSAAGLAPDAPAIELSKKILENSVVNQRQPTTNALNALKEEAAQVFHF